MSIATILKNIEKSHGRSASEADASLIKRAYDFAKNAHKGQQRKSGKPYFTHVAATGKILAEIGMDATTIAAGILHDTIEDTNVTEEMVRQEFGDTIVFLVNGVTKLGTLKYKGQERHVESLRKFFIAMSEDLRVVIIKLADRLHNLRTLEHLPANKQKRIALESIEIYAPLAYRLGIAALTKEIEDLAFPYALPKEHAMIEELLKQKKKTDQKYLDKVYRSLTKLLVTNGIKNANTEYRVKHKYSLYKKLVRKNMEIDKVYDIIALRVVVPTIEDCYRVLGIIHSNWRPLPGRIKDFIAVKKPNGYQSLHTTIFTGDGGITEIQIRTPEMHHHAEYGIAAHVLYKESKRADHKTDLDWLEKLKEIQGEESNINKFIENLKTDFFSDRIFVFTPQGDVIDLPKGASAIDFAYAIHTDIGNSAVGAKINAKYAALKTELTSSDIVEIETKKGALPSSKWLEFAKTSFAKRQILRFAKNKGVLERIFK